mmetsp:Transcript_7216/g.8970  ORF Transcript_7216/g.8970 Transcript_7216/m.8970 type:complete len:90 (-) Transcript_7216:1118-1387(-)
MTNKVDVALDNNDMTKKPPHKVTHVDNRMFLPNIKAAFKNDAINRTISKDHILNENDTAYVANNGSASPLENDMSIYIHVAEATPDTTR